MIRFENLGHREKLRQLGILGATEVQLPREELARRTVESDQLEEVLYIIQQELANHLQNFLLIDAMLLRAHALADAIVDAASYRAAVDGMRHVALVISDVREQAEAMHKFLNLLDALLILHNVDRSLTAGAKKHIRHIKKMAQDHQRTEHLSSEIKAIHALIWQKREGL
jgi:vacuolar-type H+-ATPase catalytic subunit A/Vma1